MELYNGLDIVSLGVILLSGLIAFTRGLSKEILSLLSWLAAAMLAFHVAPKLNPIINTVPFIKEFLSDCKLSIIVSYTLSAVIILIIISLFIPIISEKIHKSFFSEADKLLGLAFGVLRGLGIILILLIFSDKPLFKTYLSDFTEGSQTSLLLSDAKNNIVENILPNYSYTWVEMKIQTLTNSCDMTSLSD